MYSDLELSSILLRGTLTLGNNRISKRSLSDSPVFMVPQKPLNQTNNSLQNASVWVNNILFGTLQFIMPLMNKYAMEWNYSGSSGNRCWNGVEMEKAACLCWVGPAVWYTIDCLEAGLPWL